MINWLLGLVSTPVVSVAAFVLRYFIRPPDRRVRDGGWAMIFFGIVALSLALVFSQSESARAGAGILFLIGSIALLAGSLILWWYWQNMKMAQDCPKDKEMDEWLASYLEGAEDQALSALGITESDVDSMVITWDPVGELRGLHRSRRARRPLIVYSPVVTTRSAIGEDGIWRFRQYDVWVFCPLKRRLGVYHCRVGMILGKRSAETTDEFYYRDIVSVLTPSGSGPDLTSVPVDHRTAGGWGPNKPGCKELQFAAPNGDRTVISVATTGGTTGATIRPSGIVQATELVREILVANRAAPPNLVQ